MFVQSFQFSECFLAGPPKAARRGWLIALLIALLACFTVANAVSAAPAMGYVTAPHSGSIVINGTSTLHNWTAKSTVPVGSVKLAGHWAAGAKSIRLQSIDLTIPEKTLKSSEGGGMDNTMYNALNSSQHPSITYKLKKATPDNAAGPGGSLMFDTIGTLTVNGIARNIKLKLQLTRQHGSLVISTSANLKMTDFGVKPPTAMFGMIRSGDAITITAHWKLVKINAASK